MPAQSLHLNVLQYVLPYDLFPYEYRNSARRVKRRDRQAARQLGKDGREANPFKIVCFFITNVWILEECLYNK